MGYMCDFCGDQRSVIYFRYDVASLCISCDRNVHSANALSRRHSRTLVCERCNTQPALVRCIEERIYLCPRCDWKSYSSTSASYMQKRKVVSCYSGYPSAAELSTMKIKSTGRTVTNIQFVDNCTSRVMITSEDPKIRILDGSEVVKKYKGLGRSGSQMSASFASSGKHIVYVGCDSRIYLWDYDEMHIQPIGQVKSPCTCEHFSSDSISVTIPWSGLQTEHINPDDLVNPFSSLRESERFSFADWFSMDVSSRRIATWPEEKLHSFELPYKNDLTYPDSGDCCLHRHYKDNYEGLSTTWSLAIVTTSCDGTIMTFQNYGLPIGT